MGGETMSNETNRAMAAIEEAFYWLERYGSRRPQTQTVETTLRNARRMVAPLIKEDAR
jgi:hypothetical protein